jgi:hypothetical protein
MPVEQVSRVFVDAIGSRFEMIGSNIGQLQRARRHMTELGRIKWFFKIVLVKVFEVSAEKAFAYRFL